MANLEIKKPIIRKDRKKGRQILLYGILLSFSLFFVSLANPSLTDFLHNRVYDVFLSNNTGQPSSAPVIVDIDEIPKREEEAKISCATYAVLNLFKLNIPVGLRAGRRFHAPALSRRHRRTLLQELALYGDRES